jgi:hypothetical protein
MTHLAQPDVRHAYGIGELMLRKDRPAPAAPDLSARS